MTIYKDTFFRPNTPSVHPIPSPTAPTPLPSAAYRLTQLGSHQNNSQECVLDYSGISAHTVGGAVVDSWDSAERMLLGVDQITRLAFFSDDLSLQIFAYDLDNQKWIVNADPDFPRFTLDEDPFDPSPADSLTVLDLDSGRRHQLIEAADALPPSRLSA